MNDLEELLDVEEEVLEVSDVKSKAPIKEKGQTKWMYPFQIYFGHEYREVKHMFEKNKYYSEKEIIKTLKEHGYKEFKYAEATLDYLEDENTLFVKFKNVGSRG